MNAKILQIPLKCIWLNLKHLKIVTTVTLIKKIIIFSETSAFN